MKDVHVYLDKREQGKVQCLQDPKESNVDNLKKM
jgi:hypothetical protein